MALHNFITKDFDRYISSNIFQYSEKRVFAIFVEPIINLNFLFLYKYSRECVRNLDLQVQVHHGKLWFSKQVVQLVLEASKSAGAKGDVPKICGFVHPLHPC